MKKYTIKRISGSVVWENIPAADLEYMTNWTEYTDITTSVRMCCDDEALYIKFAAKEAEIRAESSGPLGSPCCDSCFEFFFSPYLGDDRYINIEFNPNTSMHLGFGGESKTRVRCLLKDMARFDPKVEYISDGWTLEYKVPYEFIRMFFPDFKTDSGCEFRGNFYKCGDKTPHPHYLTWNHVTTEHPNFHRPSDFGSLIFE